MHMTCKCSRRDIDGDSDLLHAYLQLCHPRIVTQNVCEAEIAFEDRYLHSGDGVERTMKTKTVLQAKSFLRLTVLKQKKKEAKNVKRKEKKNLQKIRDMTYEYPNKAPMTEHSFQKHY